jgi:hypothetical protein
MSDIDGFCAGECGDASKKKENSRDIVSNSDSPRIAPERQGAHSVSTSEMPAEMRLIGKTGFGRHVYDREIFFWRRQ